MKLQLIILIMVTTFRTPHAQSISIVYDAYSIATQSSMIDAMPTLKDYKAIYRYSLTIDKGKSRFSRDSMILLANPNGGKEIWVTQTIYKDYKNDLWVETGADYYPNHGYECKRSELYSRAQSNWTISKETKTILGLKCHKATYGDKTAWFTKEVPISDGPQYGDFGLPGLVLDFDDTRYRWEAVDIKFKNQNSIIIPKLTLNTKKHTIKIGYQEYESLTSDQAIKTNAQTPINQWLRFE